MYYLSIQNITLLTMNRGDGLLGFPISSVNYLLSYSNQRIYIIFSGDFYAEKLLLAENDQYYF